MQAKLFDVMWVQLSKSNPDVGFCRSATVSANSLPELLSDIREKGHQLVTVETRRPAAVPVRA